MTHLYICEICGKEHETEYNYRLYTFVGYYCSEECLRKGFKKEIQEYIKRSDWVVLEK